LQVVLSPAGSVNAGALWQVDSGALQTNQAIIAGLSAGVHTITFNQVSGWTTPAIQSVSVTNSQTTLATGNYVLQTGSLQVVILPSAVTTAGAKWQVDGGTLQASGTALSGLLPGIHTISFNTVLGWASPASQSVTITNTLTTSTAAAYTQYMLNYQPQLTGMIRAGGGFQFLLLGQVGSNYVVQASSNLAIWTSISTVTIPTDGFITITDSNMTTHIQRFYRAVTSSINLPQLTGMTQNRGVAQFVLTAQPGSSAMIQASSNLFNWSAILTNTIPAGGSLLISDSASPNQPRRFYRAITQ
jgi:hypothetical protein